MATYKDLDEAQKALSGKSYSYKKNTDGSVTTYSTDNDLRDRAAKNATSEGLSERASYVRELMREGTSYEDAVKAAGYGSDSGSPSKAKDPYAEIKRQQQALLNAQKQARINALSGQRKSALTALGQEESNVAPVYLQQRGNLSTTAQQTARSAEQALAARGLTRGGSAVQGDIARNVALQQGMSNIGVAESNTLADIQARRTAAEQAYQQGVAQAESESAATAAQNEIARLMQAQQAQEATVANQAQAQFEQQKMQQEQANKLQIEELRIAAAEAAAQGNFARSQELAKYKNDLEAETIKLRASTKSSGGGGGGGGGSTTVKVPSAYTTGAKQAISMLGSDATVGQKQATINTYAKQMRAQGFPESTVKQFLIQMGMGGSTLAGAPATNEYDRNTLSYLQRLGIE